MSAGLLVSFLQLPRPLHKACVPAQPHCQVNFLLAGQTQQPHPQGSVCQRVLWHLSQILLETIAFSRSFACDTVPFCKCDPPSGQTR